MGKTKEISVFVDESGSYDPDETSSLYYMVCLVFHDQDSDISGEILKLDEAIVATGRDAGHCIHTAPLIRQLNVSRRDAERPRAQRMLGILRIQ